MPQGWPLPERTVGSADGIDVADVGWREVLIDPRLQRVVECRFFAGYTDEQTARILGVAERTVRRDWIKARAWLFQALEPEPAERGATPLQGQTGGEAASQERHGS